MKKLPKPDPLSQYKIKENFKKWAKGKTLDQIADKFYEAMKVSYETAKYDILAIAHKNLIEKQWEEHE